MSSNPIQLRSFFNIFYSHICWLYPQFHGCRCHMANYKSMSSNNDAKYWNRCVPRNFPLLPIIIPLLLISLPSCQIWTSVTKSYCLTPAKSILTLSNWDPSSEYLTPTSAYWSPTSSDFAAILSNIDPWLQITFTDNEIYLWLLLNEFLPYRIEIHPQNIQFTLMPIVSPLLLISLSTCQAWPCVSISCSRI